MFGRQYRTTEMAKDSQLLLVRFFSRFFAYSEISDIFHWSDTFF